MNIIVGVDEAGRGSLIGAVIAAAVVLDDKNPIDGLADSKTLSPKKRTKLAREIDEKSIAWAVGRAEHDEIDDLNILQASLLAMKRAVENLCVTPELVLVDGLYCPDIPYKKKAIIKGDSKISAIAAASIIAKVVRDEEMIRMDKHYPNYGLAQHKGYPTKLHLEKLSILGPTPVHRKSYQPVKKLP